MCRMCIVEIDTGRGPALQPACMIQVAPDMVVDTESEVTKKAQDGVLEFLLINHPLDCPVCDKGGECPLQDQTMAYGPGESRFVEEKRHFEKPIPISDLVSLDRERCILCDRCTRFAKDVAGDPLIHFLDRGNETAGQHLPRRPVRLLLQRQHRADLPGGRAHRQALPLQGPPVGPRAGRVAPAPPARSAAASSCSRRATRCCATWASTSTPSTGAGSCDKGRFGFEAINSHATASASRCVRTGRRGLADPSAWGPRAWSKAVGGPAAAPARRASACSAAPASPTRRPTPGPSWPRA